LRAGAARKHALQRRVGRRPSSANAASSARIGRSARVRALGVVPDDIRGADDLRRLPLVDKLELTLHPERFSPPGGDARDRLRLVSSGTSGLRRRFRHDRWSILGSLAAGRRQRLALAYFVGREAGCREAVVNRPGSAATQIRGWLCRGSGRR
jgi:hypothetical protein